MGDFFLTVIYDLSTVFGDEFTQGQLNPRTLINPDGSNYNTTFSDDAKYMAASLSRSGAVRIAAWVVSGDQWAEIPVEGQTTIVGVLRTYLSRTGRWLLCTAGLGTPWTAWEQSGNQYFLSQSNWGDESLTNNREPRAGVFSPSEEYCIFNTAAQDVFILFKETAGLWAKVSDGTVQGFPSSTTSLMLWHKSSNFIIFTAENSTRDMPGFAFYQRVSDTLHSPNLSLIHI